MTHISSTIHAVDGMGPFPFIPCNILSIVDWNILGAVFTPKGNLLGRTQPLGVMMARIFLETGSTII